MDNYIIIDLERTFKLGQLTFWKAAERGYTQTIEEAGRYSKVTAERIKKGDITGHTIIVKKIELD